MSGPSSRTKKLLTESTVETMKEILKENEQSNKPLINQTQARRDWETEQKLDMLAKNGQGQRNPAPASLYGQGPRPQPTVISHQFEERVEDEQYCFSFNISYNCTITGTVVKKDGKLNPQTPPISPNEEVVRLEPPGGHIGAGVFRPQHQAQTQFSRPSIAPATQDRYKQTMDADADAEWRQDAKPIPPPMPLVEAVRPEPARHGDGGFKPQPQKTPFSKPPFAQTVTERNKQTKLEVKPNPPLAPIVEVVRIEPAGHGAGGFMPRGQESPLSKPTSDPDAIRERYQPILTARPEAPMIIMENDVISVSEFNGLSDEELMKTIEIVSAKINYGIAERNWRDDNRNELGKGILSETRRAIRAGTMGAGQ